MGQTLLQRSKFQCVDQAIGAHAGFTIDYAIGGSRNALPLEVAIANDLVAGQASGNSITLTIYTKTGVITRTVEYGDVETYQDRIYRVQVSSDPTVFIEFIIGTPPITVQLLTIGVVAANVVIVQPTQEPGQSFRLATFKPTAPGPGTGGAGIFLGSGPVVGTRWRIARMILYYAGSGNNAVYAAGIASPGPAAGSYFFTELTDLLSEADTGPGINIWDQATGSNPLAATQIGNSLVVQSTGDITAQALPKSLQIQGGSAAPLVRYGEVVAILAGASYTGDDIELTVIYYLETDL